MDWDESRWQALRRHEAAVGVWWQRAEFLEPRIRRVVAESLGLGAEELTPEVSLTDDLAADSLDLVELGLGLEEEFGITLSEAVLSEVRTYGELVGGVQALARKRWEVESGHTTEALPVRVRVVAAPGRGRGDLQRAGWLTPYAVQTIAEDALRGGRGARLEVTVPADVGDAALARLEDQFAWLGEREVRVSVRRDPPPGPRGPLSRPDAA